MKHWNSRFALVCLLTLPFSIACIHTIKAPYTVKEGKKEALMFYQDGCHLVIRTSISGAAKAAGLAWIIPLPAVPDFVREEPGSLFQALYELIPDVATRPMAIPFACSATPSPVYGIRVHAQQETAHCTTQVIELTSDGAAEVLNRWLTSHDFTAVPEANQQHYLKKGHAFLCVRLKQVPEDAGFQTPALHVRWQGDTLTLPLKFSSHSGVFDADLYVVSNSRLDSAHFAAWHLHSRGRRAFLPTDLTDELRLLRDCGAWLERFSGQQFNQSGKRVSDLVTDPAISAAVLRR